MPSPGHARTAPNHIGPDDLPTAFQNRVGLVIGPDVTHSPNGFDDLSAHLSQRFRVPRGDSFLDTADNVLDTSAPESDLLSVISDFFTKPKPHLPTSSAATPKWEAVLSLTVDSVFEDALTDTEARRPVGRVVTVVTDLRQPIPPRTLPVLKLLGSVRSTDFVHSTASYLRRRGHWSEAIRLFADRLQGVPVVFLGLGSVRPFLYDLLAILAQPPMTPTALLFPSADSYATDPQVPRLLDGRSHIFSFDGTPEILMSHTADLQRSGRQQRLPYSSTERAGVNFSQFAGLATVVNERLGSSIDASERNRLHELLFSPTQPNWDPYVHDLDFKRTISRDILDEVLLMAATPTPGSSACAIIGGSASGKTVLLKRLAFDLAGRELLVVWLSPWFYQDTQNVLTRLFQYLADLPRSSQFRPVFIMDDPLAFGATTPADVLTAASSLDLSIVLLVGVRTTDWGIRDTRDLIGSAPLMGRFELSDTLDDAEEAALAPYLVKLGIYSTSAAATQAVSGSLSKYTRDTLSTLYWLIPATRQPISDSIRDEYFRLGDSAAVSQVVIGRYRESGQVLKKAYEFAATAARYGSPIPIEVLVSALDIPYADWLEAATPDAPAWGLLYPDSPEDGDTVYYRPRNAVVTDLVLEALNGGRLSHGGETRVLSTLLSSCTGSQPQYREFCTRTLVPSAKLDHLTYTEGLRLYDDAIDGLPLEDRTLLHHKGLWIKNKGNDPARARLVLTEALHSSNYPYSTKTEPDQHIFTSLAANELDAMDAGDVSLKDGQSAVRQYLGRARSTSFFNPRAVHVGARLIAQLLHRTKNTLSIGDRYRIANEALKDVDQTLLSLHSNTGGLVNKATSDDIGMLDAQRRELFAEATAEDDIDAKAKELWDEYRNQDGFVLVARGRYREAVLSDKGTAFNAAYSYCRERISAVQEDGDEPSPALCEISLLVYYHWQIGRQNHYNKIERNIDWRLVADYSEAVLRAPTFEPLPYLYRYMRALAATHLGDWTAASAIWTDLRRSGIPRHLLFERRDPFLSDSGIARAVQGTVTQAGPKSFLMVAELGQDFLLARGQRWPRPGTIAHANIYFSFAGPTAVLL